MKCEPGGLIVKEQNTKYKFGMGILFLLTAGLYLYVRPFLSNNFFKYVKSLGFES
jgi:hypothetical protein